MKGMYDAFSKLLKSATISANYNKRVNSAPAIGSSSLPASVFTQEQNLAPRLEYLSVEAINIYNSMFGRYSLGLESYTIRFCL